MLRRLLILLIVFFVSILNAGVKEDFFQAGLGAKSNALGGTAFAFGIDSLFSNPAGLAILPENFVAYSYKNSFDSMVNSMVVGYMQPYRRGAWGIGAITMDNGGADKTEVNQFDRPEVVGTFSEVQQGLSVAFAYPFGNNSAAGIGLQYYQNNFDTESAKSMAIYAGYIKKIKKNILLGLTINNFSFDDNMRAKIKWTTGREDQFPLRYSFSAAYLTEVYDRRTEFVADVHYQDVNED